NREPHLPAAAIADEPHGIEILVRGARADDDAGAGKAQANAPANAATISIGSDMRPGPDSPSASGPSAGPMKRTPRERRVSTFACVAGLRHMRWFIAGASVIGAVVARHSVATRSSAKPCASLAIVLAVAGATMMASAQRASSRWPIACSAAASHNDVRTGRPESAWKVCAPTKRCAFSVIATCTTAPASRSRRTRSADLYAAMPPHTQSSSLRPARAATGSAFMRVLDFPTWDRGGSLPQAPDSPDTRPPIERAPLPHANPRLAHR